MGTDLPRVSGFRTVADPYTGEELYAIPAMRPDVAAIHVHEADEQGNARIYGSPGYDLAMVAAARRVFLTAERILPSSAFAAEPERTQIPSVRVTGVVHAPRGAWPTSCDPDYAIDAAAIRAYRAEVHDRESLARHLRGIPA